ncbi:MAG: hypothetical protein COB09_19055 [Thalassobium sp.]|nr:MAG: hypothetical protein COB09_19055 [Thalassobium sp.]
MDIQYKVGGNSGSNTRRYTQIIGRVSRDNVYRGESYKRCPITGTILPIKIENEESNKMNSIKKIRENLNKALEGIDALEKQETPAPKKWDASKLVDGDRYSYNDSFGGSYSKTWRDTKYDTHRLKTGNVFETKEAAEYHTFTIDVAWSIKQRAFEPDWDNSHQDKWYVSHHHILHHTRFNSIHTSERSGLYFETRAIAETAFEGISDKDFLYMMRNRLI